MSGKLPLIIGVDPGHRCGWCMFRPERHDAAYYLWRFGQVSPTLTMWVKNFLYNAVDLANGREVKLVIEGQFIDPRYMPKNMSKKAVVGLILNRARWQVMAEMLEIKVVPILPAEWQGPLLGATNKTKSEERKDLAQRFVKNYFTGAVADEHEADAVCISVYEIRKTVGKIARSPRPSSGERFTGRRPRKR